MTISQPAGGRRPSPQRAPRLSLLAPLAILLARIDCWRESRRVAAELQRLAAIGDYLLRDVGLDPGLARTDQPAALEPVLPRKPPIA